MKRTKDPAHIRLEKKRKFQFDRLGSLTPGAVGIFVTCVRGKEKTATNDALDLFNTYIERHVPIDVAAQDATQMDCDIEASIKSELHLLEGQKSDKLIRFSPLKTDTMCCN